MIAAVALLLAITSGIGIYYGIKNNPKLLLQELYTSGWNDLHARHLVCRANIIGEPDKNIDECWVLFNSNSEKSDIVNTNKEAYIGEITYYNTGIENQASLFYTDNNYYVLYHYNDQDNCYMIKDCYMRYDIDNVQCRIPSPVPIEIAYDMFRMYQQDFHINELDYLYDNYTFEDAAEFYGRISEEYVSIDEEKQQITLDGFNIWKSVIVEKCVTLDFKNRTVIVTRVDGEEEALDGTEYLDDYAIRLKKTFK